MTTTRLLPVLILLGACRTPDKPGAEGDGLSTTDPTVDADGDGFFADEDCADGDAGVNPAAPELCNGVDDNCDGQVDEGVMDTFWADADGDGFGDHAASAEACAAPEHHVTNDTDCNDTDPLIYPGAPERCNDQDDDCDVEVDEDIAATWYADTDDDGFGDPASATDDCDPGPGWVTDGTDCDDTAPTVFPGAAEECNEVDDDCDDEVDEGVTTTFYVDADLDGHGSVTGTTQACTVPAGYAEAALDCDDTNPAVNPDATEVCNGIDDDCDADIDDDDTSLDATTTSTWYADLDADGYGDASATTTTCAQPSNTVADATDCDDSAASVNPGATEVCNSLDDDCDSLIDDADPSLDTATASTWYADDDADGYGDAASTSTTCTQPSGTVTDATDCDDSAASVNPGATETCDGIDEDCDGSVDNGVIGSGTACAGTSCEDILLSGSSTGDGTYSIEGTTGSVFDVWCDMTTDGGGWALAGSVTNDGSRNWNSYTNFTSTTTWGSIATSQTADFKSDAWTDLAGDDFMVVTADYDVAWYGILGTTDVASWIAAEYNSTTCSTSFLANTPDYTDGLTTAQASAFSLTVRPLDDNCSCFPGCNETVLVGLMNASCCWVGGLGNAPNGQASWKTHDLSLLDVNRITAQTCTPGTWPCNDDGYVADYNGFCYDSSCKQTFAEVYVR